MEGSVLWTATCHSVHLLKHHFTLLYTYLQWLTSRIWQTVMRIVFREFLLHSPLLQWGAVHTTLTMASKRAPSLTVTLQVCSTQGVFDVYLFALSVTSLDTALDYHLLSAFSSAFKHLLQSRLVIFLNVFWGRVDLVFKEEYRSTYSMHCLCRPFPKWKGLESQLER